MGKEELHHCKCGGKAKVKNVDGYVWVECKKCGKTTSKYPEEMRELAVEDWNGDSN
jgi:ribosomal protein L37AE/L43A